MVNKVDRRGKKSRLIFVMSEFDICVIKLDKNKDKNTKKTNPFAYTIFRRIPYQNFQSITFSSMADNYFLIKVLNEPDSLLENRKKTEIIATVKKVSPNTQILFSDVFTVELKKKKRTQFNFQMDQNAPEGGVLKGKSIKVCAGLGKDAYPDIKEPVKVNHTRTVGGYGGGGNNDNQPPKRMEIPPPGNRGQPGGRMPPGRLPPRILHHKMMVVMTEMIPTHLHADKCLQVVSLHEILHHKMTVAVQTRLHADNLADYLCPDCNRG